jgi:hypothetical protein
MDLVGPEDTEPELDALLRAHRPRPDATWVRATEDRLLPRGRRRRLTAPVRLGTALAGGLATLVLTLSLAGTGPFPRGDDAVQADDACHRVAVLRLERVPALVAGTRGVPKVVYHRQLVRRFERRCR